MEKYILGVDVGTTGSKAIIFNLKGEKISSGYNEYHCTYPNPTWVEQNPDELVKATIETIKDAISCSKINSSDIMSLGFSVQRSSLVLLDEKEKPLKMISW